MREAKSGFKEKPACAEEYLPIPEFITCPKCGDVAELWSDEEETACLSCGCRVFRDEKTTP